MDPNVLKAAREAIIRVIDCAAEVEVVTDTEEQAARDALRMLAGIEAATAELAPSTLRTLAENLIGDPKVEGAVKDMARWVLAATAAEPAEAGRDWPEDFDHENGRYFGNCSQCGEQFMGHKRRYVCKVCAKPAEADNRARQPQPDRAVERERDELRYRLDVVHGVIAPTLAELETVKAKHDRAVEALRGLVELAKAVKAEDDYLEKTEHHDNYTDRSRSWARQAKATRDLVDATLRTAREVLHGR